MHGGNADADKPEKQKTVPTVPAPHVGPPSIEEREMDVEDVKPDNDDAPEDDIKSPATTIAGVEVPFSREKAEHDAADKDQVAEQGDETGSSLVVIDKTRLVPMIDVETFTG